jgi:hypothetical protein
MEKEIKNENSDETYIVPNKIELELSKEKKQICRNIVKEINNFGVDQRQKLFIIELLSLELENRDAMLKLKNTISDIRDKNLVKINKIITK